MADPNPHRKSTASCDFCPLGPSTVTLVEAEGAAPSGTQSPFLEAKHELRILSAWVFLGRSRAAHHRVSFLGLAMALASSWPYNLM